MTTTTSESVKFCADLRDQWGTAAHRLDGYKEVIAPNLHDAVLCRHALSFGMALHSRVCGDTTRLHYFQSMCVVWIGKLLEPAITR